MKSNSLNLKTYIAFEVFNEGSTHYLTIKLDNKILFDQALEKNIVYPFKINDYFDFGNAGKKMLNFRWTGKDECQNKHLKIYKLVVNDQFIPAHTIMTTPIENEYIQELKKTEEGRAKYRKKILYPGISHGWYGDFTYKFCLGTRQEIMEMKTEGGDNFYAVEKINSDIEQVADLEKARKL